MKEDCQTHGAPEPKIRGGQTDICVEFTNRETDTKKEIERKRAPNEKTMLKTPMKILETLRLNPHITIPELARRIGRSESAVWRAVKKLQKEGNLKRIGPDKGGYWRVKAKKEQ